MESKNLPMDAKSLVEEILKLQQQNFELRHFQAADLQNRLSQLQAENEYLSSLKAASSPILSPTASFANVEKSPTPHYNCSDKLQVPSLPSMLMRPEEGIQMPKKSKRKSLILNSGEILKSTNRLKQLLTEAQNSIQPLAPVTKFDELNTETYQHLFFQPLRSRKQAPFALPESGEISNNRRRRSFADAAHTHSRNSTPNDKSATETAKVRSISEIPEDLARGSSWDLIHSTTSTASSRNILLPTISSSIRSTSSNDRNDSKIKEEVNHKDEIYRIRDRTRSDSISGSPQFLNTSEKSTDRPSTQFSPKSSQNTNSIHNASAAPENLWETARGSLEKDSDDDDEPQKANLSQLISNQTNLFEGASQSYYPIESTYVQTIQGSLEFCIAEADLNVLEYRNDCSNRILNPYGGSINAHAQSPPSVFDMKMLGSSENRSRIYSTFFPSRVSCFYPSTLEGPSVENITDFCFPSGVQVTACTIETAFCYTDPRFDRFHIMQFTNSYGATSFACCLTVRVAKPLPEDKSITRCLLELAKQQKATRCIVRALRYYSTLSKRRKWMTPHSKRVQLEESRSSQAPSSPGSKPEQTSILSTSKSFFSRYFGSSGNKGILGQLNRLLDEIEKELAECNDDAISLHKLVELSNTLKKAKASGYSSTGNPIVEKCDQLLLQFGVGVEVANDLAASLTARSVATQQTGTLVSPSPPKPGISRAQSRSESPINSNSRNSHLNYIFQDELQINGSSNTIKYDASLPPLIPNSAELPHDSKSFENALKTKADRRRLSSSINSFRGDSDDISVSKSPMETLSRGSQRSLEGEIGDYLDDGHYTYVSTPDKSETWSLALDPEGKVLIVQQAYCVITTSPHHALIYHALQHMVQADRAVLPFKSKDQTIASSMPLATSPSEISATSPLSKLWLHVQTHSTATEIDQQRYYFLEELHRLFEESPELYLDYFASNDEDSIQTNCVTPGGGITTSRRRNLNGRRALNIEQTHDSPRSSLPTTTPRNSRVSQVKRIVPEARTVTSPVKNFMPSISLDPRLFPTTQEWTTAILFSCLSSSQIFKIINLLLMERSLVIVGKDAGVVTALTFAVTNLLTPFAWQGVFVPMLPSSVRELFDAPVPFILGTTVPPPSGETSNQAAVLVVQEITVSGSTTLDSSGSSSTLSRKQYSGTLDMLAFSPRSTPRPVGAISFSGWFTRLPEVNADLRMENTLTDAVNRACKFFQVGQIHRRRNPLLQPIAPYTSSFGSFKVAPSSSLNQCGSIKVPPLHDTPINILLMTHMTNHEKRLVNSVIDMVAEHNLKFTGDLCEYSAWPRYVRVNPVTESEEFLPELFMEPIKRVLEFHETVVQTQMFVGFVDRIRTEHKALDPFRLYLKSRKRFDEETTG